MRTLSLLWLTGLTLSVAGGGCGGSTSAGFGQGAGGGSGGMASSSGGGTGSSGGVSSSGSPGGASSGGNSGSSTTGSSGSSGSTTTGGSSGSGSGSGSTGKDGGAGSSGSSGSGGSVADASTDAPPPPPPNYTNPFSCKFAWGEPAPSSLASVASSLQLVTSWAGYEINAAGSISSCNNCTGFLKQVSATNLVPAYYAYVIGYYGHVNNLPDQNCCPGANNACVTCPATTPNLTTGMAWLLLGDPNGANAPCGSTTQFCSQNKIVSAYAFYAQQTAKVWPTKPLVWLLEGDFIQYTDASQVGSTTSTSGAKVGLTVTQLGQLAALITTAIKTNMPNAIVAIDHSNWIGAAQAQAYWSAMAQSNYDLVWTTGPGNTNGTVGAKVTYANLNTWTGRKIYVDAWTDTWSNQSAATLNALIGAGVIAFNSNTPPSNYTTLVTPLEGQLNATCP